MESFELKEFYTEADFEDLNWYGNYIRGFYFDSENYEFILDIDYISSWIPNGEDFQYKLCESTLIFHNVYDLKLSINWENCGMDLIIEEILKDEGILTPNKKLTEYNWTIQLNWPENNDNITFLSTGFTKIIRRKPILLNEPKIPLKNRKVMELK